MTHETKASLDTVYTLDDLANALLWGERYRRWGAGPVRDHYLPRAEAFKRAFGLAGDDERARPKRDLTHLLDSTLQSMCSFRAPTEGYLEAPPELVEFAERFLPEIGDAEAELDRALGKMLLALLAELVEPGRTTVTARDLLEHGFDPATPAPDPDDFF